MQLYTKILIGMAIGVILGLFFGPNSFILPQDGVELVGTPSVMAAPGATEQVVEASGVDRATVVSQRDGWTEIRWRLTAGDVLKQQKDGIAGVAGETYTGWVQNDAAKVRPYSKLGQGLVSNTEWIGKLFLALIKMVVVPLVFCSLVVGVASLGDFRKLGRLGGRTLGTFMLTTFMALLIGVVLTNVIKPGAMVGEADRAQLLASYSGAASSTADRAGGLNMMDQLIGIIPTNPIGALAQGEMLQTIFFALMFGLALTFMEVARAKPVVDILDRVNDAMITLVHIAMMVAPYGVAALLFKVVGTTGISVLLSLLGYTAVVVVGLLIHVFVVYQGIVRFGARLPFIPFLKAIRPALLLAFSTSSSSATLPVTKECVEDGLKVSPQVSSFVVPLGATVNMDGTGLYQGVAAIFIAQIYGMDLTFGQQGSIILSATMASVGAAGVPGAGMITLAMVLTSVGVPAEGLALILGMDRILDMMRTTVNVVGDSAVTAFMSRLEGDDLRIMSPSEDLMDPDHGFEGRLDREQHAIPTEEISKSA